MRVRLSILEPLEDGEPNRKMHLREVEMQNYFNKSSSNKKATAEAKAAKSNFQVTKPIQKGQSAKIFQIS